jgi:hypothetical protein|tara:strand:+ start:1396 stop:1782 length:387 start_codon:yes stop_codon:yes gene_type:complete
LQKQKSNRFIRGTLIVAGTFFLGLGILGIILPILPTTPFFLLSAACYSRGSERFYKWLMGNRWFGKYISNYRTGKGIPVKVKVGIITMLWFTISFSVFFIVTHPILRFILFIIAILVTMHLLLIKNAK